MGAFKSVLPMLAARFARRAEAQNLKGKARDRAALEFLVGATATAHELGRDAHAQQLSTVAMLVSVRGASALLQHATPEAMEQAAKGGG